jgi:hypothetical protein
MANSFALDSYVTLVAPTSLVGSFTLPPTRTEQSDCRPRLRPLLACLAPPPVPRRDTSDN